MNRYFYFILCLVLLISYVEKGEDTLWELRNRQEKIREGLLEELNGIFDLAWNNSEKAEEQLSGLNVGFTDNTPVMDKDPKLIVNKAYVAQAIAKACCFALISMEMS